MASTSTSTPSAESESACVWTNVPYHGRSESGHMLVTKRTRTKRLRRAAGPVGERSQSICRFPANHGVCSARMAVDPRHDVAIYAPFASGAYLGTKATGGGAETQVWLLARSLAAQGMRVCHVVLGDDGLPEVSPDGVTLVKQSPGEWDRGLTRRSRSILSALGAADASVYVQRTAGYELGVVAGYTRTHRRSLVFSTSSSTDLLDRPPLPSGVSQLAFQFGRRSCAAVVVQSEDQLREARRLRGTEVELIRSFCEPAPPTAAERTAFLWIGGIIDYKDPLAYVELAERVPEAQFWMVATDRGPEWAELARQVHERAARLPNLELMGERPRPELLELYPQAVAVVNTSRFEGVPNTFLEGWAHGAPALSLSVDTGGIIARHGLGAVAGGSLDNLADAARDLWRSRKDGAQRSQATRDYVGKWHAPDVVGSQWFELLSRSARTST